MTAIAAKGATILSVATIAGFKPGQAIIIGAEDPKKQEVDILTYEDFRSCWISVYVLSRTQSGAVLGI